MTVFYSPTRSFQFLERVKVQLLEVEFRGFLALNGLQVSNKLMVLWLTVQVDLCAVQM